MIGRDGFPIKLPPGSRSKIGAREAILLEKFKEIDLLITLGFVNKYFKYFGVSPLTYLGRQMTKQVLKKYFFNHKNPGFKNICVNEILLYNLTSKKLTEKFYKKI